MGFLRLFEVDTYIKSYKRRVNVQELGYLPSASFCLLPLCAWSPVWRERSHILSWFLFCLAYMACANYISSHQNSLYIWCFSKVKIQEVSARPKQSHADCRSFFFPDQPSNYSQGGLLSNWESQAEMMIEMFGFFKCLLEIIQPGIMLLPQKIDPKKRLYGEKIPKRKTQQILGCCPANFFLPTDSQHIVTSV